MFHYSHAQKFITKTGVCEFSASVPAFEPIEAKSEKMLGVLNSENGEVAALVEITTFNFPISLMQEHFNENYMDSHKFPKATFTGKINDFQLSADSTRSKVNGKLTIHGVEKGIEADIVYLGTQGSVYVRSNFVIRPEDFKIKIPKVITKKIAEEVNVELILNLKPKE
ncbi:YceI family protein [Flammeovirga agarivorans]|uniref:YceI family protein n=1 Tax=Flammeovirga agarivorans TaxID=2726742 RepID=A0A7X8SP15_9BACT|nr:YceI family protein [Flammeovirga agarivorans]NLR93670.1 YceI family protein [Flammeovirga agarivorans]